MSIVPKAFYGFMIFIMFLSYAGICERLPKEASRYGVPGDNEGEYYGPRMSKTEKILRNTFVFLFMGKGRIICFILLVAVSAITGIVAFKYEHLFLGLFTLMGITGYLFYQFVGLRFFAPYMPLIRL